MIAMGTNRTLLHPVFCKFSLLEAAFIDPLTCLGSATALLYLNHAREGCQGAALEAWWAFCKALMGLLAILSMSCHKGGETAPLLHFARVHDARRTQHGETVLRSMLSGPPTITSQWICALEQVLGTLKLMLTVLLGIYRVGIV